MNNNSINQNKIMDNLEEDFHKKEIDIEQKMRQSIPVNKKTPLMESQEGIKTYTEPETYISLGDEETGLMQIDLISFRERGVHQKYLGIFFSGMDVRENPPKKQEAFFSINSEEEFYKLKNFFQQLEWNI